MLSVFCFMDSIAEQEVKSPLARKLRGFTMKTTIKKLLNNDFLTDILASVVEIHKVNTLCKLLNIDFQIQGS